MKTRRPRPSEAGYNLIEVLIAIAIMGVLLLSIVTLFFWGRSNVYSGKSMTQAVAVGTHVLEDLSNLTVGDFYDTFQVNAASALGNYTIDGVTYSNVLLRSTDPNIVAAPPTDISSQGTKQLLNVWRNEINRDRKLGRGSVTLIIEPRQPTQVLAAGLPAPRILRVKVLVRWSEARRQRSITLNTVRFRR